MHEIQLLKHSRRGARMQERQLLKQAVRILLECILVPQVSVCPLGKVSLFPCPFWGWVSLVLGPFQGVGMSRVGYSPPPPDTWDLGYYRIQSTSRR